LNYKTYLLTIIPTVILSSFLIGQQKAKADICPSIGSSSGCGYTITLSDLSNRGYLPALTNPVSYDYKGGFVFGFVNDKNITVANIGLIGLYPINPDSTVYNSSNVSSIDYRNDFLDRSTAIINFNAPLAPGDSAYFSTRVPTAGTPCSSAVNNSVSTSIVGSGTAMSATFVPSSGVTTQEAATICGFKTFNWQQTVTNDPVGGVYSNNAPTTPLVVPHNDPPPGGYTYENSPLADSYPYYYNLLNNLLNSHDDLALANHITNNALDFLDQAKRPSFSSGQYLGYTTQLVGVLPDNSLQSLGINFSWTSNYTGTSGGVGGPPVTNRDLSLDSGNGKGGVTITGSNNITNYDYTAGFTIESINGIAYGPTFFANQVPEPSELPASIFSLGIFLILIRRRKQKSPNISNEYIIK
jgi:hypothetical protein